MFNNVLSHQCPYKPPINSIADPVCAWNKNQNNYVTFRNRGDLIGHNICAGRSIGGQTLKEIGKGKCNCVGQEIVIRINRPSIPQCKTLRIGNCAKAKRNIFCAKIHPDGSRFRTFHSICEVQRHLCVTKNIHFIDKFNRPGACNCFTI